MMSTLRRTAAPFGLVAALFTGCGPQRVAAPVADTAAAARIRESLQGSPAGTASAAAEGGAAASTGTGWATLKGRFVFAGDAGQPKPLVIDKDTEVCGAAAKLFDRSLRVDSASKGLADVVVFVRKASRVKEAVTAEAGAEQVVIFDQKNCEFLAPVFVGRVGRPIDIRNSDPVGHNTNIDGTSFNQLIPAGQGTAYTPDSEMGVPRAVTCNIHPWMKAYMLVRKDGYAAVSVADGSFQIADLPAGEPLEFQVWHARATGSGGGVILARPELKWNPKGRFTITLEADEVKDLGALEVPAGAIGT
ncbi:MAG: hypothetical protein ACKO4T_12165 [Planctomycetaceae bacterium]